MICQTGSCFGCLHTQSGVSDPSLSPMFRTSDVSVLAKARTVEISTRSFGLNSPAVSISGDDASELKGSRRLCYLPSLSETYTIWHKGHYMNVTRSQTQSGYYRTKEVLQIRFVTFVLYT